jgi:hypothetical protein
MTMGEAQTLIEINRDCISPDLLRPAAVQRWRYGGDQSSTAVLVGFGLLYGIKVLPCHRNVVSIAILKCAPCARSMFGENMGVGF